MDTTNSNDPAPGAAPQPHADDHGAVGGINPASIAAGHEPDAFAVAPILSVPLAVVVAFVIAFGVTAILFFGPFRHGPADPTVNPQLKARNDAPNNERLARVDRQGEHTNPLREVDQPRLEPLRLLENNGQTLTQMPLPKGNSPVLHAEDILPGRVEGLHQYGYVGPDKKVARIPIDEAIELATAKGNAILPAAKDGARPLRSDQLPSMANAGQGTMPPAPKTGPAAAPAGKQDEKKDTKKDEKK